MVVNRLFLTLLDGLFRRLLPPTICKHVITYTPDYPKILFFLLKSFHFEILKIQVITVHWQTLNAISRKWKFFGISKSISYISFTIILKLDLVVFRVKTEIMSIPEF